MNWTPWRKTKPTRLPVVSSAASPAPASAEPKAPVEAPPPAASIDLSPVALERVLKGQHEADAAIAAFNRRCLVAIDRARLECAQSSQAVRDKQFSVLKAELAAAKVEVGATDLLYVRPPKGTTPARLEVHRGGSP